MLKKLFFTGFVLVLFINSTAAQTIHEYTANANYDLSSWYDSPGKIIYPTGYTRYNSKTPVIFVHGISSTASASWKANVDQVKTYHLNAAFVQLKKFGNTTENGKLLKRMIDRVTAHYHCATVSIVAHSRGGIDTEKALYYINPYDSSLPSFGYEKVDGVYTFDSPLRGARVADTGQYLSVIPGWSGFLSFVAMSYTNGWSMTSGSVNSFHNWADNWTIYTTPNTPFRNYYNPSGAQYNRRNMVADNTTRWWAHQSNDYDYQGKWYYKYVGNVYHKTVGAYMDAHWHWWGFYYSNWHSSNDGFISEYRAKRSMNSNPNPSLTPGAGDHNYRLMHDANHTSIWENGENHFTREVAPYLHYGLYNGGANRIANTPVDLTVPTKKDAVSAPTFKALASNGNIYLGKDNKTELIIEEDNAKVTMIIYSDNAITSFNLVGTNDNKQVKTIETQNDILSGAAVTVATIEGMPKGVYTLETSEERFAIFANSDDYKSSFAVNLGFDENKGYNGEAIQVSLGNINEGLNYDNLNLKATLTLLSEDGENQVKMGSQKPRNYIFKASENEVGLYNLAFEDLTPGAVYSLRIAGTVKEGDVLLSRNVVMTFFVKKPMEMKTISSEGKVSTAVPLNDDSMVYPNPATDQVTITKEFGTNAVISIINTQGKVLHTFENADKTTTFSTKSLGMGAGVYILKIQTNGKTVVKKLIVK